MGELWNSFIDIINIVCIKDRQESLLKIDRISYVIIGTLGLNVLYHILFKQTVKKALSQRG